MLSRPPLQILLPFLLLCGTCMVPARGEHRPDAPLKSRPPRYGALSVTDGRLTGSDGQPAVLHGVSLGWHNWWPRFYNEKALKNLHKKWKCDIVRAAIGIEPDGGLLNDPEKAEACLETAIRTAIRNGFYIIADWHSHKRHPEEARAFFDEISRKYGHYPHLIYEIFNEPTDDSWPEVKAYAEEIVRTIRANDPDNLVLVGSPHWDQDFHLAADDPLTGPEAGNVLYTVHFYAADHGEYLRERVRYALGRKLPLFVSECAAMEASGDGRLDYAEWKAWEELLSENGMGWVAWSVSDKDETCSMLTPAASSEGPWNDDALQPWGQFVKKRLQALRQPARSVKKRPTTARNR